MNGITEETFLVKILFGFIAVYRIKMYYIQIYIQVQFCNSARPIETFIRV